MQEETLIENNTTTVLMRDRTTKVFSMWDLRREVQGSILAYGSISGVPFVQGTSPSLVLVSPLGIMDNCLVTMI